MAAAKKTTKKSSKKKKQRAENEADEGTAAERAERMARRRRRNRLRGIIPQEDMAGASSRKKGNEKSRLVKVKATRVGYYDLKRRKEGEVFFYRLRDGEPLPSWVIPVESKDKGLKRRAIPNKVDLLKTDKKGRLIADRTDDDTSDDDLDDDEFEDEEDLDDLDDDETDDEDEDEDDDTDEEDTEESLDSMSKKALVKHAAEKYSLELDPDMEKPELVEQILAAQANGEGGRASDSNPLEA